MTLDMSDVDIKIVTIVSKLRESFLVQADPQGHNSNDRHADNAISVTDTAEAVREIKM